MEISDKDNPRLRAAQRNLRDAIDECVAATGLASSMVTTAWVLYGHQAGYDDDKQIDGYFLLTGPSNDQPDHVTIGLLDKALFEARHD